MRLFSHIGQYYLLMLQVCRKPEKRAIFFKRVVEEMDRIGLDSLGIVAIVSVFMGAVVTIQMAFNVDFPFVPRYTIGYATKQSVVMEFSPTIISLILAGKVGSSIASEIGTMRVTEQIDALEIMGINPASYLILPKITAAILVNPLLIIISMFLGVLGGWIIGILANLVSPTDYIYGVRAFFATYEVWYALIKTVVFAFLITSVSGYHGYKTHGGALEVGRSSTKAVVYSSIAIIVFNLILTNLLLV